MTIDKEKQNARLLLFADFSVSPEKALLYINDMEKYPQKAVRYNQLLMQNLNKRYEAVKENSQKELKAMATERAEAWARKIAPVTTLEFVTMSKQWDIPIDGIINKQITPELIREMLDCFVIGQDEYKKKLSVVFFTYLMTEDYTHLPLPKKKLLVCGPSGSGKTYGMQVLSKLFHVPFVLIHCNTVVQEGIVGPGLTDGFTALLTQGWLPEEVERAVVCFDEFDKLFEKNRFGGDSGSFNARVVNEMLNIIDDKGEVEFKEDFNRHNAKRIKVPTGQMMFVFTGVFEGLRKDFEYKAKRKIGFRVNVEPEEKASAVANPSINTVINSFVEFGVKPEILGRIQNFVFLDELSEDELVALFDMGACSPLSEFEQYFNNVGIDTVLTEEGKHTLAKLARERKLGVRGLKSMLQQVLMEDMYDLDVGEDNVLKINRQYILENLNKY